MCAVNGIYFNSPVAEQDEQEDVAKNDKNHDKPRLDVSLYLSCVSGHFYERGVTPL